MHTYVLNDVHIKVVVVQDKSSTAVRNDLQPRIIIQSDVDGNSECKARYFFVQFLFDNMSEDVAVIWIVCGVKWFKLLDPISIKCVDSPK